MIVRSVERWNITACRASSDDRAWVRDVGTDPDRFEIDQRLITVVPLVRDRFFDAVAIRLHGVDIVGGRRQRVRQRRRIPGRRVVDGHSHDRAGLMNVSERITDLILKRVRLPRCIGAGFALLPLRLGQLRKTGGKRLDAFVSLLALPGGYFIDIVDTHGGFDYAATPHRLA